MAGEDAKMVAYQQPSYVEAVISLQNDEWHRATLVYDEGEPVYLFSHPPTCRVETEMLDGEEVLVYSCITSWVNDEGGPDDSWPTEPGTYRARGWSRHYPATVDHAEEWDAGMDWEPVPNALPDATNHPKPEPQGT